MVSDVTFTGQATGAQRTQNSTVTLAEDFTQFLQLLTTQLQNQDPLSPMDSNEFTNQLVQFSQVEQQINANTKLDNLVALQMNNAITQSLGYVGLDVSYISAEVPLEEGVPATIKYNIPDTASVSKINIYNEEGNVVLTTDAERGVGTHEFVWDGRDFLNNPLPSGTYTVSVDSFDSQENILDTTTVVTGRVKGVEQQDGIVHALVGDRAVPITNILNAVRPAEAPATDPATTEEGGADETTA
jgi:flagellar basal-body rod modification protein FlgD